MDSEFHDLYFAGNIIGVTKCSTSWTEKVIENASKLYFICKYTKDKIKRVPKQIGCVGADQTVMTGSYVSYNDTSDSIQDLGGHNVCNDSIFVQHV